MPHPAKWLWDVFLVSANLLSCFGTVEKIVASDCLTVLPVLDLDPGRRFRRVPGAYQLRDNPLHVRSQITRNRSVPLAKCWTYTSALGLRSSSFRSRVFRSDSDRSRKSLR